MGLFHQTRKKAEWGDVAYHVVTCLFYSLFTVLCIYPFYYVFINTISANDISANGDIMFWPRQVHATNYTQILKLKGLSSAAVVSLARTVLGTILSVIGSSFLGYMFTQEKMWGRKFWYRYIILTMYFSAGLIPWYLTMMNLKLTNNFLVYILPGLVAPFFIILMKTYVESIPKSLMEAAEIDGCSILRIYWRIILPVSKPILATIAIFAAVGQWNAFTDTLVLVTDENLFTLQFILYKYINQSSSLANLIKSSSGMTGAMLADLTRMQTPTSVRMTVSVLVVLPILLVYPMFQRYFISGIMIGSIKG